MVGYMTTIQTIEGERERERERKRSQSRKILVILYILVYIQVQSWPLCYSVLILSLHNFHWQVVAGGAWNCQQCRLSLCQKHFLPLLISLHTECDHDHIE
jgi:hypothetical protein